jgi:hypothetical protein
MGASGVDNLHRTGMTLSVWIKPSSAGGGGRGRILDKDNNDVGWFLAMHGSSEVQFTSDQDAQGSASRTSTASISLNTWQHVAFTWDGSAKGSHAHIYIQGALSDGATTDGSGPEQSDAGTPLTIGNRLVDLARGFDGAIDDVRVFNRVLAAAEIRVLANPGGSDDSVVSIQSVSTGKPYSITTAQVGALAYVDRSYTLTALSKTLAGGQLIQSANDDKVATTPTHLRLNLQRPATLSVCYSTVGTRLPGWLTDGTWTQSPSRGDVHTRRQSRRSSERTQCVLELFGDRESIDELERSQRECAAPSRTR